MAASLLAAHVRAFDGDVGTGGRHILPRPVVVRPVQWAGHSAHRQRLARVPGGADDVTHDIREALTLSDRVFVLSARPARVMEIVSFDGVHRSGGGERATSPELLATKHASSM